MKRLKKVLSKGYVQWLLATIFFVVCAAIYMGSAVTGCQENFYGAPGDGSGGMGWFQWADGNDPTWDHTDKSNYPYGESLKRPQFITSYLEYFPYWFFSIMTNQLCGLNILAFFGFVSSGLTMFGLVRWLLKSFGLGIFAGYAVAFAPYHVIKSETHIAYSYSGFFAALIWIFIAFYRKPSYKLALAAALAYASSFYFDGYFVFISTVLLAILLLALVASRLFDFRVEKSRLSFGLYARKLTDFLRTNAKYLVLALVATAVLLAPVVYVAHKYGNKISSGLSSSRSSIEQEATTFSAQPLDYLLPNPFHPLLYGDYTQWRLHNVHNSNLSENNLYIGYTMIVLAVIGVVAAFRSRTRLPVSGIRFTVVTSLLIIIIAGICALPPRVEIFGISLQTPSALLIQVTANWRVLARLFMIIHIAWVLLASIGLYFLARQLKGKVRIVVIVLACALTVFEFLPNKTTPIWTFQKATPHVYYEIKNDPSIKVMAEYPVIDSPSATLPFTFTFQQVHGKSLINANDSNTPQRYMRQAINGIRDDQTLPVLRALGVDMVTTYDIDASSVPGLKPYAKPDSSSYDLVGTVYSFRVLPGEKAKAVLVPIEGFKFYLNEDKTKNTMAMKNVSLMRIDPMPGERLPETVTASVDLAPAIDATTTVWIEQDGKKLWEGEVRDQKRVVFRAKPESLIKIVSPGHDVDNVVYVRNPKVIND